MISIIEWINQNSGFIIGILTLIYVVATLCLLFSNKKIRMQNSKIQEQNVKLTLFDKRYSIYLQFREVINIMISMKEEDIYKGFEILGEIRDKVYFLFGEDIVKYYLEIVNTASVLHDNIQTQNQEYIKSRDWFIQQIEKRESRSNFDKYLLLRGLDIKQ